MYVKLYEGTVADAREGVLFGQDIDGEGGPEVAIVGAQDNETLTMDVFPKFRGNVVIRLPDEFIGRIVIGTREVEP